MLYKRVFIVIILYSGNIVVLLFKGFFKWLEFSIKNDFQCNGLFWNVKLLTQCRTKLLQNDFVCCFLYLSWIIFWWSYQFPYHIVCWWMLLLYLRKKPNKRYSHKKRKDILESSLDRILFVAELAFPKITVFFMWPDSWSTDISSF